MRYGQLVSDSRSKVWLFHRVVQSGGFNTMFAIACVVCNPYSSCFFLFVMLTYVLYKPIKNLSALRALYNFTIHIPKYNISAQIGSWRIQRCYAKYTLQWHGWLGFFISPSHHPSTYRLSIRNVASMSWLLKFCCRPWLGYGGGEIRHFGE